jgi:hypothetical protein
MDVGAEHLSDEEAWAYDPFLINTASYEESEPLSQASPAEPGAHAALKT